MIHFIDGVPGSGKSMYAVKLLIAELRLTKRHVTTNLALLLPSLADYLVSQYGESFNVGQRVRLLTHAECLDFWNHPSRGVDLDGRVELAEGYYWSQKENGGKGGKVIKYVNRPDFSGRGAFLEPGVKNPLYEGTFFLIDEAHEFFNARNWQSTSEDCLFYVTQHRKLSDDVVMISPSLQFIDKQFRGCAQDFTRLRNLSKETFGIFRLPSRILRQTYLTPPTSANDRPMQTALQSIDVAGLGTCYDTSAGVGVLGRSADVGARKKGLHWSFGIAALLLIMGALAFLLIGGLHLGVKAAKGAVKMSTNSLAHAITSRLVETNIQLSIPKTNVLVAENKLVEHFGTLRGIASVGKIRTYYFSTGRTFRSDSPFCGGAWTDAVIIAGTRFDLEEPNLWTNNVTPIPSLTLPVGTPSGPVVSQSPSPAPPSTPKTHYKILPF